MNILVQSQSRRSPGVSRASAGSICCFVIGVIDAYAATVAAAIGVVRCLLYSDNAHIAHVSNHNVIAAIA